MTTSGGIYPRGFSPRTRWPWPLVKSGELVLLNYGKALRDDDRRPGSIPVYGTNGQCGWHDKPLMAGPGVVLGRKGQGPLGVEWCESGFWVIDTAYFVTRKSDQLDLRYFYYLVKHIGLNHLKDGTSNPGLSRSTFADLLLPFPPPSTQHAIAHILSTLDHKSELNRRMNETLEAIARALFKSWFVDFDPVRAKAKDRHPRLPKPLTDLFPDSFDDSELGEIPKGWAIKSIGNLADIVGGSTPSTKEPTYWEGGTHHWATPKDLSSLAVPVLLDTERRITHAGLSQIGSGVLPKGTVLLSSRAPIGYLAVAEIPVAINQGFIAMTPKKRMSNLFLLFWASAAHEAILSRANGSTFLEISKTNFRPILVVTPSAAVMQAFDGQARPLYERIVACERESRTLTTLRDTLLPKLISGELRVKDAERIVAGKV
jgi:type I restriction enzyme S subunit